MAINQISFQNKPVLKQNQQSRVDSYPVLTSFKGDTVEISTKKKENKLLEYTLIGVGALLGIIAIAKHKSIAKIFRKASDVEPDVKTPSKGTTKSIGTTSYHSKSNGGSLYNGVPNAKTEPSSVLSNSSPKPEAPKPTVEVKNKVDIIQNSPSPLVPVNQIKKSWGQSYISEIDGKDGYQLWHFTSSEFFEKFVNAHKDLSELFKKIALPGIYAPYDLDFIKTVTKKGNKAGLEFVKTVKEKTGVNLLGKITHYRFIGQSELDVIKVQKPVEPRYYGETFFTVNPRKGHSITTFDYRVTLKNTDNIVDNIGPYEPQQYSTSISVPYTYKDVEKVEKLVGGKWQEVEFLPKTEALDIPSFREEGDSRLLFKNLTAEEKKSLSSFFSKKQFTKNDYDNLSEMEKNILRTLVNKPFQRKPLFKGDKEHPVRSIAKDLEFMLKVTNRVEEALKSKYPEGFTVVSLGGSPSLITDLLTVRGYECKNIPFSTVFFGNNEAKSFNFEKYLNKFGITKENSQSKNFVFVDYVQMGHTKQAFESLMNKFGFNYKFESMDDLYKTLSPEDAKFMKDYFLQSMNIKAYVTCPKLSESSQHTNVEEVIKNYEWGNPSKLMHFAIFDKLAK